MPSSSSINSKESEINYRIHDVTQNDTAQKLSKLTDSDINELLESDNEMSSNNLSSKKINTKEKQQNKETGIWNGDEKNETDLCDVLLTNTWPAEAGLLGQYEQNGHNHHMSGGSSNSSNSSSYIGSNAKFSKGSSNAKAVLRNDKASKFNIKIYICIYDLFYKCTFLKQFSPLCWNNSVSFF